MPLYGKEQALPGFVILSCYSAVKNEFFRFYSAPEEAQSRKFCVHVFQNKTHINGIIDANRNLPSGFGK